MKKVLLLEDNKELCKIMASMFHSFGASEVKVVHSYQETISIPKSEFDYDLVFLDVSLGLGEKSGIDVFDWMLELDFKGKIIFFTGHAKSYVMLNVALKRPNVFLLEKPVEISKIQAFFLD